MKKVLIVDDNQDYVELMSEFMSGEGFKVSKATNGKSAIQELEDSQDIDVIITDILMPELDGIGLIKFTKSLDKKITIIALSGGGLTITSEDVLKTVEDQVDLILQKPVSLASLVDHINTLTA